MLIFIIVLTILILAAFDLYLVRKLKSTKQELYEDDDIIESLVKAYEPIRQAMEIGASCPVKRSETQKETPGTSGTDNQTDMTVNPAETGSATPDKTAESRPPGPLTFDTLLQILINNGYGVMHEAQLCAFLGIPYPPLPENADMYTYPGPGNVYNHAGPGEQITAPGPENKDPDPPKQRRSNRKKPAENNASNEGSEQ